MQPKIFRIPHLGKAQAVSSASQRNINDNQVPSHMGESLILLLVFLCWPEFGVQHSNGKMVPPENVS